MEDRGGGETGEGRACAEVGAWPGEGSLPDSLMDWGEGKGVQGEPEA